MFEQRYLKGVKKMSKLKLLNIITLIVFSCCNDNVTGPSNGGPMKCEGTEKKILFSIDEFGVIATGESYVNNILTYTDTSNSQYVIIEFTGSTDSIGTTYHPILEVRADQDSILTETNPLEINQAHYLQITLSNHLAVTFSLTLRCDEPVCDSAYLFINYLQIYTYGN
jgi:hypothetical protein